VKLRLLLKRGSRICNCGFAPSELVPRYLVHKHGLAHGFFWDMTPSSSTTPPVRTHYTRCRRLEGSDSDSDNAAATISTTMTRSQVARNDDNKQGDAERRTTKERRTTEERQRNDERRTTERPNDERRTTNDERPNDRTTNDERPNEERRTTNDERRTTNDERRTTNDERRTTNDERRNVVRQNGFDNTVGTTLWYSVLLLRR